MNRARVLCLVLIPTIILALLLSFPGLRHANGEDLTSHVLYTIGDSTTNGWPHPLDDYQRRLTGYRWVGLVDTDVPDPAGYWELDPTDPYYVGPAWSYTNLAGAYNGADSAHLLNVQLPVVLASAHPGDILITWCGLWDLAYGNPAAYTEANLQALYTAAHNAGLKVVAITTSPNGTSGSLPLVNSWIMNTAINVDYKVDCHQNYPVGLEDPSNAYRMYPPMTTDGVHIKNVGYEIIAHLIFDAVSFVEDIAQPSNLAPAHGVISVSRTPTLQSTAFSASDAGSTHAASQWQITKLAGSYTSPVFDSGTDPSHLTSIVAPPLGYSTYYWHVRYQGGDGTWSSWSSETSFVISSPPGQPTSVWPADEASCMTLTPTLRASAFSDLGEGDSHAASQWQIATEAGDYSSLIFDSAADTTDLTSITLPYGVLNKHTTCYWRVRYKDNHGIWSDWSTETSFSRPDFVSVELHSPGELRVYDSQGRATGWVSGQMKEEIPGSDCYYSYAVVICSPVDSYAYEVVGKGEGKYGLTLTWQNGEGSREFTAVGISISAKAVHEYTVDWDALSNGEEGVVVRVDSQGNGNYERRVVGSAALTQIDFETPAGNGLPFWIWTVIGGAVVLALSASGYYVYKRVPRKEVVPTEPIGVLHQVEPSHQYLAEPEPAGGFADEVVRAAWDRQGGRCSSCGRWLIWAFRDRDSVTGSWQSHHVNPEHQAGSNSLPNCVIFCSGIANCHFNVGHGGIDRTHYALLDDAALPFFRAGEEAVNMSEESSRSRVGNLTRDVLGIHRSARAKKPSSMKRYHNRSRGRVVAT